MNEFVPFLWGAYACAAAAIAIAFARIGRRTGDRLFGWFAAAFALLAVERVLTVSTTRAFDEVTSPFIYLVRLLAFVLILVAIAQKNRRTR